MAAKAVKKASMQVCYHIPVCHTACIHYADFKNILGASVSEPHTGVELRFFMYVTFFSF